MKKPNITAIATITILMTGMMLPGIAMSQEAPYGHIRSDIGNGCHGYA